MIKRTEGVSSTDIVGRMLMCTRVNPRISEVLSALHKLCGRWQALHCDAECAEAVRVDDWAHGSSFCFGDARKLCGYVTFVLSS